VLGYRRADGTFEASVEAREAGTRGANEFVSYDGPPSPTVCLTTGIC
jgi:isoleucyl-tRNA synthetase